MPFGNKSRPSKRYLYGAKQPIENLDFVNNQFFLAHCLGNDLVAIHKEKLELFRNKRKEFCPRLLELEEKAIELAKAKKIKEESVLKLNQQQRKRNADPVLKQEIKAIKEELKVTRKDIKSLKIKTNKNKKFLNSLDKIKEDWKKSKKELDYEKYKELHWGTKNQVSENRIKGKRDPKFARFSNRDNYQISIQIQKSDLSFDKLIAGSHSLAKLEIVKDQKGRDWKKNGTKNVKAKGILSIAVGKNIVKVPIVIHRKFPENTVITWIHLIKKRVATKFKWEVQFVLAQDEWKSTREVGPNLAAIDVGFRQTEEGLRVACYTGSDGKEDSLIIPKERLDRWNKIEDLQSIRSKEYNLIIENLKQWLKDNALPEVLAELLKTLSHWKGTSQRRLAKVVVQWRNNRFDGDEEIYDSLEKWRKQDKHLYEWQENQRKSNIRWRKDFYTNWSLNLRKKYGIIGVEKVNWSRLQRNPDPEEDKKINTHYRGVASVGFFCQVIESTGCTKKVDAKNSSKICHKCQEICVLDGKYQYHTCEHCAEIWDRDFNASKNLLSRLEAASG